MTMTDAMTQCIYVLSGILAQAGTFQAYLLIYGPYASQEYYISLTIGYRGLINNI